MKIRFRIDAEPGNDRGDDYSLRRGAASCARCKVTDQDRTLAWRRSMLRIASRLQFQAQPAAQWTALRARKRREIAQFPDISNRFLAKNRSYTKQMTKPFLTGARTHISPSANSLRILSSTAAHAQLNIPLQEETRVRYGILTEGAMAGNPSPIAWRPAKSQ